MPDADSPEAHVDFLLSMLVDPCESLTLREDAASYLGHMDDGAVLASLILVASDKSQHERLLARCGNAIAEIWDRNRNFDVDLLMEGLTGPARAGVNGWLKSK
ncbi:hypothetical protein FE236_07150 [Mariprofundus erugo]|uniref:HEAT repeat domain-containing protein n=1 Tax=Mariprofundus erugo TaxID=2528639 RepID=A0A5R9GNB9_9PROT|nr:hypothetical protein [Mariprofundus erugo]TLS65943.1 hypothetical protein FEF65_11515 [Mariprofundus erugo]TLS76400.1 hypothetical protein FE236_07150 [Mariprofundus erugo]